MKFSSFFITRPIFAIVLSLLIVVGGALALLKLPISEYPGVVPPTVVVRAAFPGANPKVIAETVASPLEQQMNGVEGMLYMFSQATSDGALTLTITFALGTDLDNAQVQVQNRVAQTLPRLPQDVQRIGVTTEKASPDFIMVVHLVSPDERYDMLYLSNYAHLQVKDELTPPGGRRRRAGLRRRRIQHARLARSGSAGVAAADGHRRGPRDPRAERPGRGRRARRAAGAVRRHLPAVDQHAGPSHARRRSSATSSCARPTTGRSRGCPTSPASSSARAATRCAACSTTSRRWRSASSSGPAPTRSRRRPTCTRRWSG